MWISLVLASLAVTFVGAFLARHAMYNQLLLAAVAEQAEGDGDEQVALNLLGHTVRLAPVQPEDNTVVDDNAAGTFIRGGGWCDGVAMALVQAAELRGIPGRILFLYGADGVSPHTVAALKIDREWRVFDVQSNSAPLAEDGELATAEDIAQGRAPVPATWIKSDWFSRVEVFYETPSSGAKPAVRNLVRALARLGAAAAPSLLQDAYLAATDPPTYVTTEGVIWENYADSGEAELWSARNLHVFGRFREAREAYQRAAAAGSHAAAAWLERSRELNHQ
jgi:hypothetical protein